MSEEVNRRSWHAWLAVQRHLDNLLDPRERHAAACRLRELLDKHISDTKVFSAEFAENSESNLRTQIEQAQEQIATWPKWMQDAADSMAPKPRSVEDLL